MLFLEKFLLILTLLNESQEKDLLTTSNASFVNMNLKNALYSIVIIQNISTCAEKSANSWKTWCTLTRFAKTDLYCCEDHFILFKPKPDLPQELNDFLTDVQQHKRDFAFIRNAAKNQKKYEKTFRESNDLLAEDIDNQFNLTPDLSNKNDNVENNQQSFENSESFDDFEGPRRFKKFYPNERYSKFLHSPIRLRRELEDYNLGPQIRVRPNSQLGQLRKPDLKYPGDVRDSQNKYHTGHVIGLSEDEKPKRRREVEISIKSDGKLVKHIEEDENGPKSIVLNIKADNPKIKVPEEDITSKSQPIESRDSIPNMAPSAPTNTQSKNIGVPINSIPARNSQEGVPQVKQDFPDLVNLPKIPKNDLKWTGGDNNHMAKSIDMAQNNLNSFTHLNKEFGTSYKKDDFEKVQGLVVPDSHSKELRKYKKRDDQHEYDYIEPLNLETGKVQADDEKLHLDSNHPYEVIEMSTKNILVIPITTTTECPLESEKEEEAEKIGHAIAEDLKQEEEEENTECSTPEEEEEFKIIKPDETSEKIKVVHKTHHHHHHHHSPKRPIRRSHVTKNDEMEFRDRKHLPTRPKYKRKRVRQHPRKMSRLDNLASSDYYDLNELYEAPNEMEYIPSYRQRGLKSVEYEFDPNLIRDFDSREKEEVQGFVGTLKGKNGAEKKGVRKKFKSDGDYSDEEDSMTSSPEKKMPVKKTRNELAVDRATTIEDNDDDYDYSDLTDMDEDEDITYEEVDHDKLEADEVADNRSKDKLEEKDRLAEEVKKQFNPLLSQLEQTTQTFINGYTVMNVDDVLMEADQMLAAAHGRGGNKKTKKRKPFMSVALHHKDTRSKRATSNLHKRRRKRKRRPRTKSSVDHQPQGLSDQQKQDLFLRYNPDFQRWPRFADNDQQFHEMMRRRALDDRRRYYRNFHKQLKREETSSLETSGTEATSTSSEAASTAASETTAQNAESVSSSSEIESSSVTGSEEASSIEASSMASESSIVSESVASMAPSVGESQPAEGVTQGTGDLLTGLDQASLTLPQAAQNILQTANSDIFENTTVPELGALQSGAPGDLTSGGGAAPEHSTQFQFTTIVEDLTTNTQCGGENVTQKRVEACEDESAKHSPGTVTSVLPLIKEAATESLNLTKDQFLNLDEILVGDLPKNVVVDSLTNARGSVRQGLRGGKFNLNLLLSGYNSSAEANLILTEMASLMKKLKYHTSCQMLPPNLKTYLKIITKNEMDDPMTRLKDMNEIDFDDHQSNYVFHSVQNENIQDKAQVLRDLLTKYQNLPTDCKERAEPVKEYIESHLAMVEHMGSKGIKTETVPPVTGKPKVKKEISMADSDVEAKEKKLEEPMLEEGLGNQKADANELIEEMEEKTKRNAVDSKMLYREIRTSTSPQFGKLVKAVRTVRNRRQVMRRIGEIYGRAKNHLEAEKIHTKLDKGFEAPRVINL